MQHKMSFTSFVLFSVINFIGWQRLHSTEHHLVSRWRIQPQNLPCGRDLEQRSESLECCGNWVRKADPGWGERNISLSAVLPSCGWWKNPTNLSGCWVLGTRGDKREVVQEAGLCEDVTELQLLHLPGFSADPWTFLLSVTTARRDPWVWRHLMRCQWKRRKWCMR